VNFHLLNSFFSLLFSMSVMLRAFFFLTLSGALLSFSGCSSSGSNGSSPQNEAQSSSNPRISTQQARLQAFQGCEDYRAYLADSLTQQYLEGPDYGVMPLVMETDAAMPKGTIDLGSSASAPETVSGTNLQEAAVDEPDLVKSDDAGNLFLLRDQTLHVVDAFPAEAMRSLASIELGVAAEDMFYDNQTQQLVILGAGSGIAAGRMRRSVAHAGVEVLFVNVRDLTAPTITAHWLVEGSLIDARRRLADRRVQLAVSVPFVEPQRLSQDLAFQKTLTHYYQALSDNADNATLLPLQTQIQRHIADEIAEATTAELLPSIWEKHSGEFHEDRVVACDQLVRPDVTLRPGMTLLLSFDASGANRQVSGVLNNAWQLYASPDHLYLLQSSGGWWWSAEQEEQSVIWQFDWTSGHPEYQGVGLVDGHILNSFSLSEHEGHLRVATTERQRTWSLSPDTESVMPTTTSQNHLFILQLAEEASDNRTLTVVGSVLGLAPGERVQSARFLGDRGFVVTFRQVDPLFAFDLSDPRNPELKGELKISGFSSYLHPLDQNHLLTVGPAGDDRGLTGELQVQIFDVTDLSNPQQRHSLIPARSAQGDYSYSETRWDHHAFTYHAPSGLLSIPLQTWNRDAWQQSFSGFVVIAATAESGLRELENIAHQDLVSNAECASASAVLEAGCSAWQYYDASQPRRSVVMTTAAQTWLYTISRAGIKAARSDNLSQAQGSLSFP
jgi:hypothetical protein